MSIAHWAAAHRRSILFLLLILALGGAASAFSIPVALFPHVDFPRIVVTLNAGDRPAGVERDETATGDPVRARAAAAAPRHTPTGARPTEAPPATPPGAAPPTGTFPPRIPTPGRRYLFVCSPTTSSGTTRT